MSLTPLIGRKHLSLREASRCSLRIRRNRRKYLERLVFETLRDDDLDVQNAALDALKRIYKEGDRKRAPQSTPEGN